MRPFILLTALLPVALAAQTTFAPIGAKWSYTQQAVFDPSQDSTLFVIECTGDTVIQGRTCSILEPTAGWGPSCMGFAAQVTTSADSVLLWNAMDEVFTPLHIFGLPPGSSWKTLAPDPGLWMSDTITYTVLSSGTITVDGIVMRTTEISAAWSELMYLFPYGSGTITERLGDTWYLFPWSMGACDGDVIRPLRCYEDPDISWQNPQFAQCALGVGVGEHNGSEIVIRPTLAFQGEPIQVVGTAGTLEVFDATGSLVRTHSTSGQLTFELDRSGLYLLRLTSGRGELAIGRILVR